MKRTLRKGEVSRLLSHAQVERLPDETKIMVQWRFSKSRRPNMYTLVHGESGPIVFLKDWNGVYQFVGNLYATTGYVAGDRVFLPNILNWIDWVKDNIIGWFIYVTEGKK